MRTFAILALALAATPASAFLPERDEYEPVRIERCDVLTSPSISDDGSCLSIGGAASFAYARSSRDGTFGGAWGALDFTAVSEAGPLLTQALVSIQVADSFPPSPFNDPTAARGNVSIGGDTWTVRAGGLQETALNFTDDRPLGMTLGDLWWGSGTIISETGIQATAEISPGVEATLEHGVSLGNLYSGGSLSYTSGPLASHFTVARAGPSDEWILHTATSIIENDWSALAAIHISDDDWNALASGSVDIGNFTLAGFYGHDYNPFLSAEVLGIEGSYRLTDDLQVAASFSRRTDTWGDQERTEISVFQTITDTIEAYATVGQDASPGAAGTRQFIESGIKYEPTENIEMSIEGLAATDGTWRIVAVSSVAF